MELFSVTCTTCRARLKVREFAAIGQILSCPKCQSMIQVVPPPGWKPPNPATTKVDPANLTPAPGLSARTPVAAWRTDSDVHEPNLAGSPSGLHPSMPAAPPADASQVAASVAAPATPGWLPWACVPLAAVGSALAVWFALGSSQSASPPPVETAPTQAVAIAKPEPVAEKPPAKADPTPATTSPASALSRRWLPAGAKGVVTLRVRTLLSESATQSLVFRSKPLWQNYVGKLLAALALEPDQIERLTFSTLDPSNQTAPWIVAIELKQAMPDASKWLKKYQPLPDKLGPLLAYESASWPDPFVLDASHATIVSGPLLRLGALCTAGAPGPATTAVEQAWDALDSKSAVGIVLDLAYLRKPQEPPAAIAIGQETVAALERWGAPREESRVVLELPLALGLGIAVNDEELQADLTLVCESKTAADKVEDALDKVTSSLQTSLTNQRNILAQNLLSLPMSMATADQVHLLIDHGMRAVESRTLRTDENLVRMSTKTKGELPELGVAGLTSIPALEMTRLALARALDEQRQRRILTGLLGYVHHEGTWPAGAGGSALLPPESRLSWIAELLPYYDEFAWHRKLNFAQDWNSSENRLIAKRPLDPFINPALGLSLTEAGFPVTHYVGLAGVGSDAAENGPAGPQAGVFAHRVRVDAARITDGASNTIALMGVSGNLGPWAAGGQATVRALTAKPYVNGPDGFGSGQSDGMFVGMADGSVRFISKDIDPSVLEHLATIHGGEPVELAKLDVTPRPLPPMPVAPPAPTAPAQQPAPQAQPSAKPITKLPAEPAPRPALPQEKLPPVDAAARLQDKFPAIEFPPVPWDQFLKFFTQLTTVPTTIDPEAMVEAGIHLDDRVEVHAGATTAGDVLRQVLSAHGLEYLVYHDQLLLTTPESERTTTRTVHYDVRDLAPTPAGTLASCVREFVEPTSWAEAGGQGTVTLGTGELIVKQTGLVQRRVAALLGRLRAARELPQREKLDPRLVAVKSRWARARPKLDTPVTANFRPSAKLSDIRDQLEASTAAHLLIDQVMLAEAGRSVLSETSMAVEKVPLAQALAATLKPLGLGFRAIDEQTLQITTLEGLREHLELELYPVRDLVRGGPALADEFVEKVKAELAAVRWSDTGGPGSIGFDPQSMSLIVLHNQPVQRQLEELLERWRAERAAKR